MPTAITHDPVFTTPVSSTNTAVVRWSGTAGAVLQDSGVLIDGSNNITGAGTIGSGAITSTGGITGTQVDILAQGDLRLQDTTGGQYVALQAAGTTTTHTLTLPATQGSASTVLTNNGSGTLTWAAPSSGPSQAVEADIESETNQDTYIPPDLAKHIPGAAKFWGDILLAGTLTGTDYNVASITDNGVGYRTVVYTTAMAESNYPVQVTNRGHTNYASSPFTETHTTSGMDIRIRRTESPWALMDERNNVTGYGLA